LRVNEERLPEPGLACDEVVVKVDLLGVRDRHAEDVLDDRERALRQRTPVLARERERPREVREVRGARRRPCVEARQRCVR
jgi:hypothetical protein